MIDKERKLQIIDLAISIVLFVVGCIVGKIAMTKVADTWWVFNGSAIGIVVVGGICWFKFRKHVIKK